MQAYFNVPSTIKLDKYFCLFWASGLTDIRFKIARMAVLRPLSPHSLRVADC